MPNVLEDKWVSTMTDAMCLAHPDIPRQQIKSIVSQTYSERVQDTKVQIYNNYENIVANTTLLGVVNWIDATHPAIAESGVFFYPKDAKRNVNAEIIEDCMLNARTIHKKEKFAALEAGDTFTASIKHIQQLNDKKAANSGYGAEGQSSSFLYNIHSAMSVTACGRGQLSTACQCYENLLADNVKFFHVTEFLTFVTNIIHERSEWELGTFDVVDTVPSKHDFVARFMTKFGHETLADQELVENVYDALDEEMRVRVYYKANLRDFVTLPAVRAMFTKIVFKDVEFIDPNEIPDELKKPIDHLMSYLMEFVAYKHGVFRYEDRTRYQKRAVTLVLDTDSNFLYFGSLLDYLYRNVFPLKLFRKKSDATSMKLRALNTLNVLCARAIRQRLDNYLGVVNVAEKDRKFIKMKNEFYYSRVMITFAKKSYVGLQIRQEQTIFKKPVLDVKGVNFFKSTASEDTSKFIYDDILMGQLLQSDEEPSLRNIYRTIYKFQERITDEIANGNMGYLKRSIKVKTPDAYANPLRIGQYKAVYVWNKIVPDADRIKLPATVTLVKVVLRTKKDASRLENWPDIYDRVIRLFDTDPEIGDYVDEFGKTVKGKGVKAIALPDGMDDVPDWVLAIIDTETLVSDNMKLFTQIFKPLGLVKGGTTHNGSSMTYYTNIVRI